MLRIEDITSALDKRGWSHDDGPDDVRFGGVTFRASGDAWKVEMRPGHWMAAKGAPPVSKMRTGQDLDAVMSWLMSIEQ